jgi:hypothetical protein
MEDDVLWKAAMRPRLPTGLGKRPPNHHPRFPQLPQPLPLEKKARQRKTKPQHQHPDTVPKLSSMSPVSVLDVPVGSGEKALEGRFARGFEIGQRSNVIDHLIPTLPSEPLLPIASQMGRRWPKAG